MNSNLPITQAIQSIYDQVEQVVLAQLEGEWFVTEIRQDSIVGHTLFTRDIVSPLERVLSRFEATYRVQCQNTLLQQRDVKVVLVDNGTLRITEVMVTQKYLPF